MLFRSARARFSEQRVRGRAPGRDERAGGDAWRHRDHCERVRVSDAQVRSGTGGKGARWASSDDDCQQSKVSFARGPSCSGRGWAVSDVRTSTDCVAMLKERRGVGGRRRWRRYGAESRRSGAALKGPRLARLEQIRKRAVGSNLRPPPPSPKDLPFNVSRTGRLLQHGCSGALRWQVSASIHRVCATFVAKAGGPTLRSFSRVQQNWPDK